MHENQPRTDPDPDFEEDEHPELAAFVATFPDSPDELTLRANDAKGVDLMRQWITACVDDVVDLDEMR